MSNGIARVIALALIIGVAPAATVGAQSTTATVSGRVTDSQGLALPGVTVTASSPNLQGARTTVTAENGDYVLGLLPPGAYTIAFELAGFDSLQRQVSLAPTQTLRHVLLPQALRLALPPMTNDFVSLLKDSSLVSVITVIELTKRMTIAAVDMRGWLIPGLACAAFYLALSFPLSELARRLERRLARDQRPHAL